jgi:hypothetical protein
MGSAGTKRGSERHLICDGACRSRWYGLDRSCLDWPVSELSSSLYGTLRIATGRPTQSSLTT